MPSDYGDLSHLASEADPDMGELTRQAFVLQLEEARAEWKRRHGATASGKLP